VFYRTEGIWRFVTADRAAFYAQFLQEYATVRHAEGRGSESADYYRALPFEDRSGRLRDQWRVRAASYRAFAANVLEPLEKLRGHSLAVLDLGAGNCWLSYRLARRGHEVAAVDLNDDRLDGLAAHQWYAEGGDAPFVPVQADFDRLPFASECADLVVFNSSLHYSTDYADTLREASRVVRSDGAVVILDSPVYRDASSGHRMVQERHAFFERRYGFPSNAIPSENFLTPQRLEQLAAQLALHWQIVVPRHGVRWALRPWLARVKRRREPAAFWMIVGRAQPREASSRVESTPMLLERRKGLVPTVSRVFLRVRYLLFQRHRARGPALERVVGREILVLPGVFNPKLFRSGEFLGQCLDGGLVPRGSAVLDMGTGSGIGAVIAATRAAKVVAVDINPEAVRCARINAIMNGVEQNIEVRHGNLFEATRPHERFDLVLFNPPFFRGSPRSLRDAAWRSEDVPERFADGLRRHLTNDGCALVVLSSDGDAAGCLRAFQRAGLRIEIVARRVYSNEEFVVYRVSSSASRADGDVSGEELN
jgi:HemK-related putative methylase